MANTLFKPGLLKVLLCLFFVWAIDALMGAALRYLYFKPSTGKYHDLTYAIDSAKADVIIIGSSRAAHTYVSAQIEDSLHMSCYNAGMEAAMFLHQYATFEAIVKRSKPKIVIWDYWQGFAATDLNYQELTSLAPYYYYHPEVRKVIDETRPWERYKMLCRVYPFNSTLIYNLNKVLSVYKNAEKDASVKGWIPLRNVWSEPAQTLTTPMDEPIDRASVGYYREAIRYCKANNIKFYTVISPYLARYTKRPAYDTMVEMVCRDAKAPFMNYFSDTSFVTAPQYFSEPKHLNAQGAHLFTAKVIKAIKADLQKSRK